MCQAIVQIMDSEFPSTVVLKVDNNPKIKRGKIVSLGKPDAQQSRFYSVTETIYYCRTSSRIFWWGIEYTQVIHFLDKAVSRVG
jgi:hypothetical protein